MEDRQGFQNTVETCKYTSYDCALASFAFLASIFAPTFRMFCAARSIPPLWARSYIFNAVSRLSTGCQRALSENT